jgi:hypothetical protein
LSVVDLAGGQRRTVDGLELNHDVEGFGYDRDGDAVICGLTSGEVVVASLGDPRLRRRFDHGCWVTDLSVAANRLAVADETGGLSLWQRPFGESPPIRHSLETPDVAPEVALSPTAARLAVLYDSVLVVIDLTG